MSKKAEATLKEIIEHLLEEDECAKTRLKSR